MEMNENYNINSMMQGNNMAAIGTMNQSNPMVRMGLNGMNNMQGHNMTNLPNSNQNMSVSSQMMLLNNPNFMNAA